MSKMLVILRGLPGSGKSTWILNFVKNQNIDESQYVICSADHYFIRPDGVYDWSSSTLKNAHAYCQKNCIRVMQNEFEWVFIDNTNIERKHFQVYLSLAETYGYEVREVIVGSFDPGSQDLYHSRCLHRVPIEGIRIMAKRFEQ